MELLERQTQREELTRHVREAGTNAGEIAFVGGEAGAGKSVLVEQFTRQAGRGVRVLWGHCDALQTSRVLGPVTEVLAALSAASGTAGAPSLSREQLFSRLLERLSPPNPLSIVVLEDLHWADEATLDFVRFLGRRIQRTRCLLIVTYRDDELTPAHPLRTVLGELTGEHAARLRVDALSLAAVEQLERGADLSQLVHHASHAQDVKALLEYAPRAAQHAAHAGAHREAVAHLATALRHADSLSAPERARLLESHATECDTTNQVSACMESANQA